LCACQLFTASPASATVWFDTLFRSPLTCLALLDVVFVILLIQMWMYPVDKTRANEVWLLYTKTFDQFPFSSLDKWPNVSKIGTKAVLLTSHQRSSPRALNVVLATVLIK